MRTKTRSFRRFQVLDKEKGKKQPQLRPQLEALEALEALDKLPLLLRQMAMALDRQGRRPMRPLRPRRRWASFQWQVATCRVACRCQQRARSPQVLGAH